MPTVTVKVAGETKSVTWTDPQPNPGLFLGHVPGKIYLGWSTNFGDTTASSQLDTVTPGAGNYASKLGLRRLYSKSQSVIDYTDAQNRVLWISAKGPELGASGGVAGWAQVANGSKDASIRSYFASLVSRNKLTIFSFHHEPIGDTSVSADATTYVNACRRIRSVVDTAYPGHRILFCFNYEENRLRNLRPGSNGVRWDLWIPADWQDIWDFPSFDFYQYGEDTSTNPRAGVEMSHRWWRIDELFSGDFLPSTSQPMPWMNYTPGVDVVFGIGETSARPGSFYNWQNSVGDSAERSNMTGAKWARDQWNYIFSNPEKFAFVSTFNSIGADPIYNEERLYPAANGDHGSFLTQTGDTELTLNVYREKLNSGLTVKLAANGLPPS
jgi:hypothetical protein